MNPLSPNISTRLEQLVFASAMRVPDRGAVVDPTRRVSYSQLREASLDLASALLARGMQPTTRVCLLMPKSVEAVTALLALLANGGVYVPLDATGPARRLAQMLRTVEPCWLFVDPALRTLAVAAVDEIGPDASVDVFSVEDLRTPGLGRGASCANFGDPREPEDLAVILFTSGSTGEPKGVPLTHDAIIHFVNWSNEYFDVKPSDRLSCHSPLHFDASVWDIFRALTAGAELHLVPPHASLLPSSLAAFIRASRLTQWDSVPSVLAAMASRDVVARNDFPDLKWIIWYGEAFHTRSLGYWMERLPHVRFTNTYGPTETTVTATYYTVPSLPHPEGPPVPIGHAVPGKQVMVIDALGQPAPPDAIGELYVGGIGVCPGYWRDPARTAAFFVERPPGSGNRWYRTGDRARIDADGICHFHGRADRQIKSRGNRIELDEIALAMSRLGGVTETAVVAVPSSGFEGTRICAAYVLAPGSTRDVVDLRAELAASLPPYMLPLRWLELESLPRNRTGKIDHCALELRFVEE